MCGREKYKEGRFSHPDSVLGNQVYDRLRSKKGSGREMMIQICTCFEYEVPVANWIYWFTVWEREMG